MFVKMAACILQWKTITITNAYVQNQIMERIVNVSQLFEFFSLISVSLWKTCYSYRRFFKK